MRRGFTLIELLAVIVILAIISLIAVPIVINIINDSKINSQKRSIDMYAKAVEQAVADYQLKNNKKVEGRFSTTDGKILTREDTTLNVDYKGNIICNKIIVNKDGSIYVSECAVDGDKVYKSKNEGNKDNLTYYEYGKTTYGMIAEKTKNYDNNFLSTDILSSNISKLIIHTDGINITDEYESIDCSGEQDKSVMCYWKGIENKEGFYEMHIASDGEIYTPVDSSWLFYNLGYNSTDFTELDLTGINTKYTKNMSHMFESTGRYMTKFDFGSSFDTSNVTNMYYMFAWTGYKKLRKFTLKNFDTSNVKDMSYMFYVTAYESLNEIDLGNKFDTSNVTNMSYMFSSMGGWNLKALDLGKNFNTKNVTNMEGMFLNTGSTSMKTLNLGPNFDTSKVENMYRMFDWVYNLESLDLGDKFDTKNVTNMGSMFGETGKNRMTSLNLGNKFDTSNVTNMDGMFYKTGYNSMTKLNLGDKFNTLNVTNMGGMFDSTGYKSMTSLNLGDKFDTSSVTSMGGMFRNTGYNSMTSLNLGNKFNTSSVTSMGEMFLNTGYNSMTSLNLGDKFDTSKVTNMSSMFKNTGYKKLIKLDLGKKFVANTDVYYSNYKLRNMFEGAGHDSMTELYLWNFNGYTRASSSNKQDMFKDCGIEGILTKVVVSTDNFKTTLKNDANVPDFWKSNDGDIIQVQTP